MPSSFLKAFVFPFLDFYLFLGESFLNCTYFSFYYSCFPFVFLPFWILTPPQLHLSTISSPPTGEKSPPLVAFSVTLGLSKYFY